MLTGQVVAVQANFYRVLLDQPSLSTTSLLCVRRARLKKMGQQVYVGDRVVVTEPDWQGQRGAIAEILPRKNHLARPAIVNIDRLLFLFALKNPDPDPLQISRFLVQGESTHGAIVVCFNKRDLVSTETWHHWHDRLTSWGYPPLGISVSQGEGIESLQELCLSGITVLTGPSGVGKSSLINALIPDLEVRTGTVSDRLGKGKHTTRHVELFTLVTGGRIADTPGFLQPNFTIAPQELAHYFPEARQRLLEARCNFTDCLHREEPGCVVRGDWERYSHYCSFLSEVEANYAHQLTLGTPDHIVKQKARVGGATVLEPRLSRRKHRRTSRRTTVQAMETLYSEELETTGEP